MAKWRKDFWGLFPECANEVYKDFGNNGFCAAMIRLRELFREKVVQKDFNSMKKILEFALKWSLINDNFYDIGLASFFEHCFEGTDVDTRHWIRSLLPTKILDDLVKWLGHESVYGW